MDAGDDGIKVRAVCPAGHETVTSAPKGRLTWRGQCHTEGCEHRIVARKVLDAPGEPTTEPTDPPKPKKKIRKVAAYRGSNGQQQPTTDPTPGFDGKPPAGGGGGGGGGPAGVPAAGADTGGPGSGLLTDEEPAGRRSVLRRTAAWRKQRRERLAAAVDDGKPWTIPGIYR